MGEYTGRPCLRCGLAPISQEVMDNDDVTDEDVVFFQGRVLDAVQDWTNGRAEPAHRLLDTLQPVDERLSFLSTIGLLVGMHSQQAGISQEEFYAYLRTLVKHRDNTSGGGHDAEPD